MQSKQELQLPTDAPASKLEMIHKQQKRRLFNQTLMGFFMIVFFFYSYTHACSSLTKGKAGNPLLTATTSRRTTRTTRTHTHIQPKCCQFDNGTQMNWRLLYDRGLAGRLAAFVAFRLLYGSLDCHHTAAAWRWWWCPSSLCIAKVITFNMKRTAPKPTRERGYGIYIQYVECGRVRASVYVPA